MAKEIYGQDALIKQLDIIFRGFKESEGKIKPHFTLTGPSGNGKTETIEYFVEKYKLGFVEINAASITKEGLSGNSLSKALSPLAMTQNVPTVVFVDEFDKLYLTSDGNTDGVHEATRGVQNEFLKVLEGKTTQVFGDYGKFNTISTKNALFVFAGAFNNETGINIQRLSSLGIKREFLGRVPLVYEVKKLDVHSLLEIAKNHIFLQEWLNITTNKDEDREQEQFLFLGELKKYIESNYDSNVIGARWIGGLIHTYFINKKKFPDKDSVESMPNPSPLEKKSFYDEDLDPEVGDNEDF